MKNEIVYVPLKTRFGRLSHSNMSRHAFRVIALASCLLGMMAVLGTADLSMAASGEAAAVADEPEAVAQARHRAYPPRNLGRVGVGSPGDFPRTAALVYGSADKDVLAALSRANPDVKDFSGVPAGKRIVLPALEAQAPPPGVRLIRVGRVQDATGGLEVLGAYAGSSPGLRLFVSFHPERGLLFDVIVQGVFPDPEAARAAVAALPPGLAGSAVVQEDFEPGTIFYTRLGGDGERPRSRADGRLAARDDAAPGPW